MSYVNYALANTLRKQKKEITTEIENGSESYNLYVEDIKKETEKAFLLSIESREKFNARTLEGYTAEHTLPPLEMWIPKSLLNKAPMIDEVLDCVVWKQVEINMDFIVMLFVQL